jgi:hypothetical protein
VAHKGTRSKCCQGHLQGLKLQKIRILPLVHLPLLMEMIPITNHSTQILSGMHLSHYNGLVVVLDVPSDWGLMTRDMPLHNHCACPNH